MQVAEYGNFPDAAKDSILETYRIMTECSKAGTLFENHLFHYENNESFNYNIALSDVVELSELCGVKSETATLVYILCLTEHLRKLYTERGLDEILFRGVIEDIKVKNDECYSVKGIYGTFVGWWFVGYFNFELFALGRLQFQPRHLSEDIEIGDIKLNKGNLSIGVHIPSGRPLVHSECEQSLKMAYDMFLPRFPDGTVIFDCTSWLLAPDNRKFMRPDSNIVKFMNLFHIVPADKNIEHDLWRIFGVEDCSDTSKLPKDNTLRRIYAELIDKGEIPLMGKGIIVMRDGVLIR